MLGTGEPAEVLAGEAAEQADQLLGFLAREDDLDAEVAYVAGIFHLLRAEFRGEDGQEDRTTAAILLVPLHLTVPDALPDPVRSWLDAARQAAEPEGTPPEQALAEARNNLGMLLLGRLVRLGERHSGAAAVGLLRQAAEGFPEDHPSHALALCNLGYARMLTESEGGSVPADIDGIVGVLREAFRLTPEDNPNYARCANGLALAVGAQAAARQDVPLLTESIGLFRTAVGAATDADGNLPQMLTDLASALLLWWRNAPDADPGAPDEAIAALTRALALTPRGTPEFDQRWDLMRRLEMARATRDARVRQTSPENREAYRILDALVSSLPGAGTGEGAGAAAGEGAGGPFAAILRLLGMGEPGKSRHAELMDFGAAVLRYPHEADLEEIQARAAGILLRRLAHLTPQELPEALANIMSAEDNPVAPAAPVVDQEMLDEVAELHERLLRELPEDDPDRVVLRLSRGQLSLARIASAGVDPSTGPPDSMAHELSTVVAEVARTIDELPRVLHGLPLTEERIEQVAALGSALLSPFETLAVIDREIRRYRARLAELPDDHPDHLATSTYLAHTLFARYRHTTEDNVFQEAVRLARHVVAASPSPPPRLVSAWGSTLAGLTRQAGFAAATDGDPAWTSGIAALGARLTADAINGADPAGALEHLEDARATMLSHALNTRRELDNLYRADPELAERFAALREEIHAGMNPGMEPRPDGVARFRALLDEWAELVERVKALPGFDRFLMPVTLGLADLAPAAAEGPVVTVNLDTRRCDALVLHDGRVRVVRLPGLRVADAAAQADAFQAAIAVLSRRSTVDGPLVVGAARRTVVDTLGWLWDVLAEPVLAALDIAEHDPGRPWPRLWWSPSGPLTFLPVHAAGRPGTPGASVLDRVVPSYTPTLRALLHSRSRRTRPGRSTLAVAIPQTPGRAPLPATVREATAFAAGGRLVGAAATRAAVRAALPGAAVVHFACHAESDPADASASHLLLHDGPLTVTEVSQLRLDAAELAYLSACATARGSAVLADEAIHVASAFQLAGYAQAVATLWEVGDEVAARVAAEFHRELAATLDDPDRPAGARALHAVTRRMRDEWPDAPWRWAAYVHAGA
ncbi:CHAT domain-containing protein [Gandjariella thermophila]|uniref:CHAT domain-containing protein n=1 Tax=Gandjariella thermophila TaxID=1931992 RepID=A0A4D4J670_9PSEU|nr:CHAT domain-containing protein [Gandjariella thermophila]